MNNANNNRTNALALCVTALDYVNGHCPEDDDGTGHDLAQDACNAARPFPVMYRRFRVALRVAVLSHNP